MIDDGSTDNSFNIVNQQIIDSINFVNVIKINKNFGKGNALNFAKKYINTSHVVIHDADLEYNPKDILKMVEISKISPNSLFWGQDLKVT